MTTTMPASMKISDAIDAQLGTRKLWEVADLFCGAGGTSQGARRAIMAMGGDLKLVCVNHWQVAVDTHKLNHPYAEHVCEDVEKVRPLDVVPKGRLHLLLASPSCVYHSLARGGRPVEEQGRMGPWAINNWLTQLYVERMIAENVPQFVDWGPICGLLDDHKGEHVACAGPDPDPICGEQPSTRDITRIGLEVRDSWLRLNDPDKLNNTGRMVREAFTKEIEKDLAKKVRGLVKQARKYGCTLAPDHAGEHDYTHELPPQTCRLPVPKLKRTYFQAWIASLWALGYEVDWKILNAADYGDATTRKRFFLQARRDGKPIRWPEPTHAPAHIAAKPRLDGKVLLPYVSARKVIDWSDKGLSIFDRIKELSENTRLRMARGLQKFGGPMAPLYIELLDLPEKEAARYRKPETWSKEQQPFVFANRANNVPRGTDQPIAAITTSPAGGGNYVVTPEAQPFLIGQQQGNAPQSTDDPAPTVVNIARIRLFHPTAEPFVVGRTSNTVSSSVEVPLNTATGRGVGYLAEPIILPQHAGGIARSVDDSLPTITGDGTGVANPMVLPYHGKSECYSVDEPLKTLATKEDYALVEPTSGPLEPPEALTLPYGPPAEARPVTEPIGTIPTKDRWGLAQPTAQPMVMPYHGADGDGTPRQSRSVDDPLSTIHAGGKGHSLVQPTAQPWIQPHWNERPGQAPRIHSIEEPLPATTSRGSGNLVEPVIIQTDNTGGHGDYVRDLEMPLPTQTSKQNLGLVEPILMETENASDKQGRWGLGSRSIDAPLMTITGNHHRPAVVEFVMVQLPPNITVDPRRLVLIDGTLYVLDILYRMLKNLELARAMGFSDEETTYEFTGTQTEVTKQIGNAVAVHQAAALVSAILWDAAPEMERMVA